MALLLVCALSSSASALETRRWLYGSLAGLAVGAGAGIGIGAGVCDNPRGSDNFCTNKAAGMTYLGIGLGAMGFGLGGVINYALTKPSEEKNAGASLAPSLVSSIWIDPEGGGGLTAAMAF